MYRAEDGEHVGYVAPAMDTRWQALTVFGYPLGGPAAFDDSVALLEAEGLAVLADRWSVRHGEDWLTCRLVETSPETVVVRIEDFGSDDFGKHVKLERPGPEVLKRA
ncbi:hypothetical protein GCM10027598_03230 [Amycolatopsis oliviviridis]|uniref:Uncharacterized protein n=1 Tax=Amycolatopsis oliviviridis TaxID=1471590 RepID=A0ABQ3LKB0_9PSEU|nr:hypothetical protein GCM10017790_36620 [Amycolatopsis oliviviridis]